MTLPLPQLDKRNWSDLVAEGLVRIPRRDPEWTDHNLHDPGITLLELLAYKAEQTLFQTNRVSERLLRNVYDLLDDSEPETATSVVHFPMVTESLTIGPDHVFEMDCTSKPLAKDLLPPKMRMTSTVQLYPISLTRVSVGNDQHANQRFYAGADVTITFDPAEPNTKQDQPEGLFTLCLEWQPQEGSGENRKISIYFEIESDGVESTDRPERTKKKNGESALWWLADESAVQQWTDETTDLSRSGIIELEIERCARQITCFWKTDIPWPTHRKFRRIVVNAARVEHAVGLESFSQGLRRVGMHLATAELSQDENGFQELDLKLPVTRFAITSKEKRPDSNVEKVRKWKRSRSLMAERRTARRFEVDGTVIRFGNGQYGAKLPANGSLIIACDVLQATEGISTGTRWRSCNSVIALEAETVSVPLAGIADAEIREKLQAKASRLDASSRLSQLGSKHDGTLDGLPLKKILSIPAPAVAVTATDYERLAFDTPGVRIVRAHAYADVDVNQPGLPGEGTLSIVVLPDVNFQAVVGEGDPLCHIQCSSRSEPAINEALKVKQKGLADRVLKTFPEVLKHLNRIRSMGTKLVVSGPRLSLLQVDVVIDTDLNRVVVPTHRNTRPDVRNVIKQRLTKFFDPVTGGVDGTGCPWGESVSQRDVFTAITDTGLGQYVVSCSVTQIGKWFPWSMPLVRILFHDAGSGS